MLTWGAIGTVKSLDPAFAGRGTVGENQVAIWVPVPGPDGRGMFVPYIWLDNPMSLTTRPRGPGLRQDLGKRHSPARRRTARSRLRARPGRRSGGLPLLDVTREPPGAPPQLRDPVELVLRFSRARNVLIKRPFSPNWIRRSAISWPEPGLPPKPRMKSVFLKQVPAVEGSRDSGVAADHRDDLRDQAPTSLALGWPVRAAGAPDVASQPLMEELGRRLASSWTSHTGARWTSTSATAACCGRAEATARGLIAIPRRWRPCAGCA